MYNIKCHKILYTKQNKMKKLKMVITVSVTLIGFAACNTPANNEAKNNAVAVTTYVDSVNEVAPVYTVSNWAMLNDGYQEKALKAEKTIATLEAADKAKLDESKAKYQALKENYERKLKENEASAAAIIKTETSPANTATDYRKVLRDRLFGEGKIGADIKFDFVTADNILGVYKNFVNIVADNKNNYTREDWDEIKVLYEALDTRKNKVEKDLSSRDNLKIAGQKIRFATIKATKRGGTKGAENQAAKE